MFADGLWAIKITKLTARAKIFPKDSHRTGPQQIKRFFQLIIRYCRTNINKFHPRYFKFASGQLIKSALARDRTASIMTRVSDGFCIVKITNLVVWTYKFLKIVSRTYSITGLNDFPFSSILCSESFRYSVQNLTKFIFCHITVLLTCNSAFVGPDNFRFCTEKRCMVSKTRSRFGAN